MELIQEVADEKEAEDAVMLYERMHEFLHWVEDCRILLLTGTPIWDQTYEIASQMNLILPLDQQLPQGVDFDNYFFDSQGGIIPEREERLREAFRGRISFLRPTITTAQRKEMGTTEPWLHYVKVYPDAMSEFQSTYAVEARETIETRKIRTKGKEVIREIKGGTVLKLARNAVNMVIPIFDKNGRVVDGAYDQDSFRKYAVKQKMVGGRAKGGAVPSEVYAISDPLLQKAIRENLAEYSTKFASIIQHIKDHPKEVVFVQNEFVTGPGGAIMFALCLQLHGFIWAKTAHDILKPSEKKRFVLFTSKAQTTSLDAQIQEILTSAGKADNIYGDRLQVIIGSAKIAEGWTIKFVRQAHYTTPHWNIPSVEQALARGYRFGSHKELPPEERYIKIYRHVAVNAGDDYQPPTEDGGFPEGASFSKEPTVDLYIYKIAEEKEFRNTQIYRIIKETAFDCALNYHRNVLPEDEEGSRSCDYRECNYQCEGMEPSNTDSAVWDYLIPEGELDRSTYDLYYNRPEVMEMSRRIVELFGNYFSLHVNQTRILLEISNEEIFSFYDAIEYIINSRTLIRNRYGFGSYLKEAGNILFLDNNISPVSNYAELTYISTPFITESTSFGGRIEILELKKDHEAILQLCKRPNPETLARLSYRSRVLVLEMAYELSLLEKLDKHQQRIVDFFDKELQSDFFTTSDEIVVHNMYAEEYKGLAYDVTAREIKTTGLMRWFDPEIEKWRYITDPAQEERYLQEIKETVKAKKEKCETSKYGICGWISKKDGALRLTVIGKKGKGDVRGLNCRSFSLDDLIDIFVNKIRYLPPPPPEIEDLEKGEVVRMIEEKPGFTQFKKELSSRSRKELLGLATLMNSSREEICRRLREWLEEHDLLVEI